VLQLLAEIRDLLKDIRNILHTDATKPIVHGKTYGFTLTLTVGQPVTKVFFSAKYRDNQSIPPGQTVFAPHRHIKTLIMINEGPADILYQVNGEPNEEYLTSILRLQEDREIDSDKDGISGFFARAVTGSGPNPAIGNTAYLRVETIT
jgi:hypothetical protein